MKNKMNIIAINGSPRAKKANTYQILKSLLQGMEKIGAKTKIINLSQLNIKYCKGCRSCLKNTSGNCVIKDDMFELLKKISKADLIIYGTPLHFFTMTGLIKNFIDRTLPLVRRKIKKQKMFLVSPCGCPSMEQFKLLIETFKYIAKMTGVQYLGEILRTIANFEDKEKKEKYFKLLYLAGQQLIESNKIDDELLNELHSPWISLEEWKKLNPWFS
jgi:multimeric flavodoxin WrbA